MKLKPLVQNPEILYKTLLKERMPFLHSFLKYENNMNSLLRNVNLENTLKTCNCDKYRSQALRVPQEGLDGV